MGLEKPNSGLDPGETFFPNSVSDLDSDETFQISRIVGLDIDEIVCLLDSQLCSTIQHYASRAIQPNHIKFMSSSALALCELLLQVKVLN